MVMNGQGMFATNGLTFEDTYLFSEFVMHIATQASEWRASNRKACERASNERTYEEHNITYAVYTMEEGGAYNMSYFVNPKCKGACIQYAFPNNLNECKCICADKISLIS